MERKNGKYRLFIKAVKSTDGEWGGNAWKENNEEKQYTSARQKSTDQHCADMIQLRKLIFCYMQSLSHSMYFSHILEIWANNGKLSKVNSNRNWTSTTHNFLSKLKKMRFLMQSLGGSQFSQLVLLFIINVGPEKQRMSSYTNSNNHKWRIWANMGSNANYFRKWQSNWLLRMYKRNVRASTNDECHSFVCLISVNWTNEQIVYVSVWFFLFLGRNGRLRRQQEHLWKFVTHLHRKYMSLQLWALLLLS